MGLKEDLEVDVDKIFKSSWTTRKRDVVPGGKEISLGNEGVELVATVLYADLSSSTSLVDTYPPKFAAEIYKSYLVCSAKIVKSQAGVITAYDGDRIMAVFIGAKKNTRAVKAAFKINHAVVKIINPAIKRKYAGKPRYVVNHVVGIDTSPVFVAKIGVKGANDRVWVGRAANYAAKLSNLDDYRTYITHSVYDDMDAEVQFGGKDHSNMWTLMTWRTMNDMEIYGSNWKRTI